MDCILPFKLRVASVLLKACGLKGKKRSVHNRTVCLPEKHKTEISSATTDGVPVNHELISTLRTGAHHS